MTTTSNTRSPRNHAKHTWRNEEMKNKRHMRLYEEGYSRKKLIHGKRPIRGNYASDKVSTPSWRKQLAEYKQDWIGYLKKYGKE